jgi:hypothetical protein
MGNLASLMKNQGKLGEAEPLLRETLEARRTILGAQHPRTLTSMSNLAALLHAQGKLVESEALYREALTTERATLGVRQHVQPWDTAGGAGQAA